MTEQEQREWLWLLGRTTKKQIDVLRDLIIHAREDNMKAADRAICVRQLERLEKQLTEERTYGRRSRVSTATEVVTPA